MAKETTTRLVDDLDGVTAEHTVTFAFQGAYYEIDLNEQNLADLAEGLRPFIEAARPTTPEALVVEAPRKRSRRRNTDTTKAPADDTAIIRAWAREHGWPDLGDRGRLPAEVRNAYCADQADTTNPF